MRLSIYRYNWRQKVRYFGSAIAGASDLVKDASQSQRILAPNSQLVAEAVGQPTGLISYVHRLVYNW